MSSWPLFRCPPDCPTDILTTRSRHAPAGIVRRHRRKRRGQQCKGNAFHPTFKIPGQILSTKYRQSPPRRRSVRRRGSSAGTTACENGLPTARNPERRRPNTPEFRRSRSSGGPQRDIPGPLHTRTARHRGLGAPEPRGSRGLGAQGARSTGDITETSPLRTPPAVSGPSPRSRHNGTCRRPRGGRAGRHPRSPRCSAGSGTPAR